MHRRTGASRSLSPFTAALVLAACGGDDDDDDGAAPTTTAAGAATETGGGRHRAGATAPMDTSGDTETVATTGDTEGETDDTSEGTEPAGGGAGSIDKSGFGLIDGVYTGRRLHDRSRPTAPRTGTRCRASPTTRSASSRACPRPVRWPGSASSATASRATSTTSTRPRAASTARSCALEVKDDAYTPDKTKTNVDEALGAGSYAGFLTIIGTPNNLAVWDVTNDECMPQLLNGTGAAAVGRRRQPPVDDRACRSTTSSEAGLWVEWLQAEHPDATTVAAVAFNNDFGNSLRRRLRTASSRAPNLQVVDQQFHEPTAPDLTNQFTTMAATDAEVLLIETSGAFCTQAMAEVEKNTAWNPIVIMSATCASLSQFFQPLVDQGLTGAGTHVIQYLKDVNDAGVRR